MPKFKVEVTGTLEHAGHVIVEAKNATEAIRIVEDETSQDDMEWTYEDEFMEIEVEGVEEIKE